MHWTYAETSYLGFDKTRLSSHRENIARLLKLRVYQVQLLFVSESEHKDADQSARMHRLVCAFSQKKI